MSTSPLQPWAHIWLEPAQAPCVVPLFVDSCVSGRPGFLASLHPLQTYYLLTPSCAQLPMKTSWLGPNAPKFLTLCASCSSESLWWFPSPGDGLIRRLHVSAADCHQESFHCPVHVAVLKCSFFLQAQGLCSLRFWPTLPGTDMGFISWSRPQLQRDSSSSSNLGTSLRGLPSSFISWSLCKPSRILDFTQSKASRHACPAFTTWYSASGPRPEDWRATGTNLNPVPGTLFHSRTFSDEAVPYRQL